MATQQAVAGHLDLTDRQVRNLLRDGVLPPSKGAGGYDLDACRQAYIRYLRGVRSGQVAGAETTGEELDYELERARLTKEQRIAQEMKNRQAAREWAPVAIIRDTLAEVGAQIDAILDSIPGRVKRVCPGITAAGIEVMRKEIVRAQNAAADVTIDLDGLLARSNPGGDPPGPGDAAQA